MSWRAAVLFPGKATGEVLRFDAPISFWGGIDPTTSRVTLTGHPQHDQQIAGKVLVIPQLVGSSSSSAVMLELLYARLAPKALILGDRDAILPVGVLVAGQMQWNTIPVLVLAEPVFQTGDRLRIRNDGTIESV